MRVVKDLVGAALFQKITVSHEPDLISDFSREAISWVTTTMVIPVWAKSCMVFKTSPTISGSKALVGSSKSIMSGCWLKPGDSNPLLLAARQAGWGVVSKVIQANFC